MKVGDKVYLITPRHGCGSGNPVWGMRKNIEGNNIVGTITSTTNERAEFPIRVTWGDYNTNIYNKNDLVLASCKSIQRARLKAETYWRCLNSRDIERIEVEGAQE